MVLEGVSDYKARQVEGESQATKGTLSSIKSKVNQSSLTKGAMEEPTEESKSTNISKSLKLRD